MARLVERYTLTDPVADLGVGEFASSKTSALYSDLVNQGRTSVAAALRVGATIEDLDLADLEYYDAMNDNQDIAMIFAQSLAAPEITCVHSTRSGSQTLGETYNPQLPWDATRIRGPLSGSIPVETCGTRWG